MKIRKRFLFFLVSCVILFVFLVVSAVWLIDSPAKMQMRKQDTRVANDLSVIANIIYTQYMDERVLPENILAVESRYKGGFTKENPFTGVPYEYVVLSDYIFELCATFSTSNLNYGQPISAYVAGKPHYIRHEEGRQCFEFDVKGKEAD